MNWTDFLPLALIALWETAWWVRRLAARRAVYAEAQARAQQLGRQLVVIGAPDLGPTGGPGCGDVTIDIDPGSACPHFLQLNIEKTLPFSSDSVVVFISYVLEYVDDPVAALRELRRIGGAEVYGVFVEAWTLTGHLYPGAQRTLPFQNGRLPA